MAKRVLEGSGRGYYTLPGTLIRDNSNKSALFQSMRSLQLSLSSDDELWYRYSPGPNKRIQGFNIPFIDGYYYVRKNPQLDLRRQLYALETMRIPSSGNTELFEQQLNRVNVPNEWCPYYLDPCPDNGNAKDWCTSCKTQTPISVQHARSTPLLMVLSRWVVLAMFALLLGGLTTLAVTGE